MYIKFYKSVVFIKTKLKSYLYCLQKYCLQVYSNRTRYFFYYQVTSFYHVFVDSRRQFVISQPMANQQPKHVHTYETRTILQLVNGGEYISANLKTILSSNGYGSFQVVYI